jgi:DNA adenine methylase
MKPFLKWVGGKTQLLEPVLGSFPKEINDYHEIFVGGGSVLFAVLDRCDVRGKIHAYDLNETLINVYKDVQSRPKELYAEVTKLFNVYDRLTGTDINRKPSNEDEAMTSKESYYYWVRHLYNSNVGDRSAMFIFLNKTCFRGVFREGPNGFNVPYGHYKSTPQFVTLDEFEKISKRIQRVEFVHCDFRDAIARVKPGDFMYLDPPYAPETKTSFVGYTKDGFGMKDHEELFALTKSCGAKFTMSNAGVDLVRTSFCDYNISDVKARRAINSKNPEATTTEVIVRSSND